MEFRMLDVLLLHAWVMLAAYLGGLWASSAESWHRVGTLVFAAAVGMSNLYRGLSFDESLHQVLSKRAMSENTTMYWGAIGK